MMVDPNTWDIGGGVAEPVPHDDMNKAPSCEICCFGVAVEWRAL